MRKAAFVLVLFCLVLSGCNSPKTVSPVTKGIKFDLKAAYGETDYDLSVAIDNGGCMKAVINSPAEIKGMKLNVNNFETIAEYKDLKHIYNSEEFADNNPIITVHRILSDLSDKQLPLKEGENCIVEDRFSGKEYEFIFSPSGLPISFNMNAESLSIVFHNVTVL